MSDRGRSGVELGDASSNAGAMVHLAICRSVAALTGVAVHVVLERTLLSGARGMLGLNSRVRAPVGSTAV